MSRSELVSPQHLQRKALIYIRQSTPRQVLEHRESTQRQYGLRQQALHAAAGLTARLDDTRQAIRGTDHPAGRG